MEWTLGQWLEAEKSRLDEFGKWYLEQARAPDADPEVWPLSMPTGEWDEQQRAWEG